MGNLRLQVDATTLRGRPYQPIPMWVTLRGDGNAIMINELIVPTADGALVIPRLVKPSATDWQETKYLYDIVPQRTGTITIPGFQLMVFSPAHRSFKRISSPAITLLIGDADMPVLPYPPDLAGPIDHMPVDGRPFILWLWGGCLLLVLGSELWLHRRRSSLPPSVDWPRVHRNALVTLASLSITPPSPEAGHQLYQLGMEVLSNRLQQPLTPLSHEQLIGMVLSKGGEPEWVVLLTEWGECVHRIAYAPDGVSLEPYQRAIALTRQLIQKTAQWRPSA